MTQAVLSHAILADYAAGNLDEAFDLVVAAHVSLNRTARRRLAVIEAAGGALLDAAPAAALAPGSLEATLARIAQTPSPVSETTGPLPKLRTTRDPGQDDPVLPRPVRDYVGGGLPAVRWRSLGMGCKQAILTGDRRSSARLLFIPAGAEMPDHGHSGTEMTLVLQGAFLDGEDRFARGDVEVADSDTIHRPIADIGEDCICLAACEGGLRFVSLLPRLAAPFLRI